MKTASILLSTVVAAIAAVVIYLMAEAAGAELDLGWTLLLSVGGTIALNLALAAWRGRRRGT